MGSADERVIGKANPIKGLVEYQEGSVVSRTIIDRKVGTVTVFAFDEGQALSEHQTPYDALVFIVDGKADILISNESKILMSGEMIVMPRNVPHAVKAVTRFKMVLVMIRE